MIPLSYNLTLDLLRIFNIQQNEHAIYQIVAENEPSEINPIVPIYTQWRQFKFIPNHHMNTPRNLKTKRLVLPEDDEEPCYHNHPAFRTCILHKFSNKILYSTVHFGKPYYENPSVNARSSKVFCCAQHQDIITCFDLDSEYLVTGSAGGDIKVWKHREESNVENVDESFELVWLLEGVHTENSLLHLSLVPSIMAENRGHHIVSGGGPYGVILM